MKNELIPLVGSVELGCAVFHQRFSISVVIPVHAIGVASATGNHVVSVDLLYLSQAVDQFNPIY